MKKIRLFLIMLFSAAAFLSSEAQTVLLPNFAVSSHPFMVNKVAWLKNSFEIELTLENKSPTGYFCVSKRVYLQDPITKKKIYMTRSEGIPVCPDVYHFKWIGEKLTFRLFFPKPDTNIRYIDVIEQCQDHCFSIFGLILDKAMNDDINKGYSAFGVGDYAQAYLYFKSALEKNPDYPYGFLYANIIKTLLAQEKYAEAKTWYQKLQKQSFLLDKKAVLDKISKENDFDKLK